MSKIMVVIGLSIIIFLPLNSVTVVASTTGIWSRVESEASDYYSIWGDGSAIYTCGNSPTRLEVVKWTNDGFILWNQTFTSTSGSHGNAITGKETALFTCGYVYQGINMEDLLIVKWNATGGVQLWNYTWGSTADEEGLDIWTDGISAYTCGLYHEINHSEIYSLTLIKWDALTGARLWNHTFGNYTYFTKAAVWGVGDCIYVCKGNYLGKWNSSGIQTWNTTLSSMTMHALWGDDRWLYACGDTGTNTTVLKWDTSSDMLVWSVVIEEMSSSIWGFDEALYVAGSTLTIGPGGSNIILSRLDVASGSEIWMRTWGTENSDRAFDVWCNSVAIYTSGIKGEDTGTYGVIIKWGHDGSAPLMPRDVWNLIRIATAWILGSVVAFFFTIHVLRETGRLNKAMKKATQPRS